MTALERLRAIYNVDDLVFCQSYIIEADAEIDRLRAALSAANEDAETLFYWANSDSSHSWRCLCSTGATSTACTCGLMDALNAHNKRLGIY